MTRDTTFTRKATRRDEGTRYVGGDMASRMAMVWPLSLRAWQLREGCTDEPRLRRDVVRIIRGRRD